MARLKKAANLRVGNTKIGAYATSLLKSDDKGKPRKNTPFSLLCLFFATIDSWKVRCCNSQVSPIVPISVVHGKND